MPLSIQEIQVPRTPTELLAFVESVRERAKTDAELRRAGHLRTGHLKEFFDEVVPLSKFAVAVYPCDYKVCPILGNQGYDAEIHDERGHIFERVEIANPVDGRAIAETGRELAKHCIGGLRVGDPGDDLEDLIPIIERTALKKSVKDYSDATVVFNVSACPPFKGFERRHEEQLERISSALNAAGFRAKRVYVMLPTGEVERVDA
ncbi:hypothetical protein dqs_1285 [Azoarcus olearius]|uniref:hypothetical protein n=1 Tax=Azoarcus sp. (strain BH72) TaxID=418699 RepID=UPI0008062F29|nr:hypothetical protein [Azoarcus olearius]ANQ84339.1 hypothetical protein dqs_1285 [Azoarcus olearius]